MKSVTKSTKKTAANTTVKHAPLDSQPEVKSEAAVQVGLFLFTDDHWAQAYFKSDDLHCRERVLFS
ncbi:MAG TPA: hypothetical protein VKB88_15035 [Bryobacteraceae bacterium]|nr:hypothetical protein [Bryobacteraceae bacterium]